MHAEARVFVDTNVLIYAYSTDEPDKQTIAREQLMRHACVISTQVLSEFCNTCVKKLRQSPRQVRLAVGQMVRACDVLAIEPEHIERALDLHERHGYSYYDSLIIAAALSSDCRYLWSEDLQDGQTLEGRLTIVNIFKSGR